MKACKNVLVLTALAAMFSVGATAQGTLPGDPDNGVPLDGGLSIAIIAGVGYGAKRLMKKKNVEEA